jgi:hypothetical protein
MASGASILKRALEARRTSVAVPARAAPEPFCALASQCRQGHLDRSEGAVKRGTREAR